VYKKNESRREIQCGQKIGGTWEEINETQKNDKGKET
jgi:hypothetical protein